MKIMHIIPSFNTGGAEKFAIELCNELSKHHEVYICSITKVKDIMLYREKINENVNLIELGFERTKISLPILINLYKIIKKIDPDILHAHITSWIFNIIFYLSYKNRIFITIHSTLNYLRLSYLNKEKYFTFLRPRIIHIAISESICINFETAFPNIRFHCIPNGITSIPETSNTDLMEKKMKELKGDKQFIFISLGSINSVKNQLLLAQVALSFQEQANFVVFGVDSNTDINYLHNVKKVNSKNLFILDKTTTVHDYLIHADALIVTSKFEGLPLVILEALRANVPVISTSVGGISDVIENKINGFLSRNLLCESMREAIQKFINLSSDERLLIKENNKKHFEKNYIIDICAKKHVDLYNS